LITDALVRRLDHCNAEQLIAVFDGATSDQQSEIIRRKLRGLQRRLHPEDYASLAHLFRRNLRQAADRPAPRRTAQSAVETLARRVMFATVLGVESRLEEIVARRGACVAQQTSIEYQALLCGLIHHGGELEPFQPDDQDCFSARLDQLLRDLADIDPCLDSGDSPRDFDRDAVLAMAAELSLGWLSGSTTLYVAGQQTIVPNVTDIRYQKLLLYDAAVSPCVTPLSVYDVEELLDSSQNVEQPAVWSVSDVVLAETAGHVYRLLHGLERCCSLDSPSCVLTGLVVYDRLCRLRQLGGGDGPGKQEGQQNAMEDHDQAATEPATRKNAERVVTFQQASQKTKPSVTSRPDSG